MKINTKYNIGDRIWIVYEANFEDRNGNWKPNGEVSIYDTNINGIFIGDDGLFYEPATDISGIKEEDIIPYEDKDKLLKAILNKMKEINEREEKG